MKSLSKAMLCENNSEFVNATVVYIHSSAHYYFSGILLVILIAFGLGLNTIVVYVFTRQHMRLGLNILLAILAVSDMCFLITCITNQAIPTFLGQRIVLNEFLNKLRYVSYPAMRITYTTSLWLLVCASIERHLAVCYPLRHSRLETCKSAIILGISVIVLALVINFPAFLEFNIQPIRLRNRTMYKITENVRFGMFTTIYHLVIRGVFHFFLPLALIGYLNVSTYLAIRRARILEKALGSNRRSQHTPSIMLLSYSVFFCVCHILPTVRYFTDYVMTKAFWCEQPLTYLVSRDVAHFLLVVNTSISFVVYVCCGTKFRHACLATFLPQKIYSRKCSSCAPSMLTERTKLRVSTALSSPLLPEKRQTSVTLEAYFQVPTPIPSGRNRFSDPCFAENNNSPLLGYANGDNLSDCIIFTRLSSPNSSN